MPSYDARDFSLSLDPTELKPLYKLRSHVHALDMLYDWVVIIATAAICIKYPSIWLYILSVIVIGARMHALAILMHDATHYRFLKKRKWNDRLTNYLTMYPIFTSIENYRANHLAHHQNLNTDEDPDWAAKLGTKPYTFPKSKSEFIITLLSYFLFYRGIVDGLGLLVRFGKAGSSKKKASKSAEKIVFYLILFSLITVLGIWKYYLLFWIVPYLSTLFMFQYIRSVAEHFGELKYENLLNATRTTKPTLIERFFFAPHEVGYHLEHHLYPGVPYKFQFRYMFFNLIIHF